MTRAEKLLDYLDSETIKNNFETMLNHQESVEDESKDLIRKYFWERVESIKKSINDIVINGDEDEFSDIANSLWLELRLEWNRYNCQMQYQTVIQGQADPVLMAKGACLAELVDGVEKTLDAQSLYWVIKIAVNPIESVSHRISQTKKLIEKTSNYGKISQSIINNQLEILEYLQKSNTDKKVIQKFKSNLKRTINTIEDTGFLTIQDFADCIEGAVITGMKDSNLQFQVSYSAPSTPYGIPPEIAHAIEEIVSNYIVDLCQNSMEDSPEQREGKSPFVNFNWEINLDKDFFYFSIKDDCKGTSSWKTENNEFNELSVEADIINSPGEGTQLNLVFSYFAVHDFVVFEVGEDSEMFAIPASKVLKLIKEKDILNNDNYPDMISEKAGSVVQSLKWPTSFSEQKEFKNYVIFRGINDDLYALGCNRFLGFYQTKLKKSSHMKLCGDYYCGFLERDRSLVKVLNTDIISRDFYAEKGCSELSLRAG